MLIKPCKTAPSPLTQEVFEALRLTFPDNHMYIDHCLQTFMFLSFIILPKINIIPEKLMLSCAAAIVAVYYFQNVHGTVASTGPLSTP